MHITCLKCIYVYIYIYIHVYPRGYLTCKGELRRKIKYDADRQRQVPAGFWHQNAQSRRFFGLMCPTFPFSSPMLCQKNWRMRILQFVNSIFLLFAVTFFFFASFAQLQPIPPSFLSLPVDRETGSVAAQVNDSEVAPAAALEIVRGSLGASNVRH